jgi:hypothetical protein
VRRLYAALVAGFTGAVLYLMLDSRLVTADPAAPGTSGALGALGVLFGLGAVASWMGGQPERTPFLAGLAAGVGGYALFRLAL